MGSVKGLALRRTRQETARRRARLKKAMRPVPKPDPALQIRLVRLIPFEGQSASGPTWSGERGILPRSFAKRPPVTEKTL